MSTASTDRLSPQRSPRQVSAGHPVTAMIGGSILIVAILHTTFGWQPISTSEPSQSRTRSE